MTDGRSFFDQQINNETKTNEILEKLSLVEKMITRLFAY